MRLAAASAWNDARVTWREDHLILSVLTHHCVCIAVLVSKMLAQTVKIEKRNLEAAIRIELMIKVLQTSALPLGYAA